ncbi:uncharacterized protein LOC132549265 [Ylistrum balloti]|uniref:uncharacterized protein LOC132549265 n=1 Tax=Ylistrum balloti TaxID=509963 RepID=UPI002905A07E|nr:uncharacterized protein LOC132549265 [Ylistrum balloti]
MSPSWQGFLAGVLNLMVMWLGGDTYRLPLLCPQETSDYTVRTDIGDNSIRINDTCGTNCIPQDENFACSVHNETGWGQFQSQYQPGSFLLTNANCSELVAIGLHHMRYNKPGQAYLIPALSITINISAEMLGASPTLVTRPPNPDALLVRVSGVNDTDSFRDDLYTDTPLYRLYRFSNYTPTTRDNKYPRQAVVRCIDNLDACSVKIYELEITTFAYEPGSRLMTRSVYTITSPNSNDPYLPPVIATTLKNSDVTVVFETGGRTTMYSVGLVKVNKAQTLYRQVEIAGNKYLSHPFCVSLPGNMDDGCLNELKKIEDHVDADDEYFFPVLAYVIGTVFTCIVIAVAAFLIRYRMIRLIKHDVHKISREGNMTRILLLNRQQDQQMAKSLVTFVETHFPSVEFISVELGTKTDVQKHMLMKNAIRLCDQVIVIWSHTESEGDRFVDSVTNGTIFTSKDDVNLTVVFSSDLVDKTSIPVEFNGAHKFDLTSELESFCQHCFSVSPVSSESIQEFHNSPSFKNFVESYKKVYCNDQVKTECDRLLGNPYNCAVHDTISFRNAEHNIGRSETSVLQEDIQPDHLVHADCPIHEWRADSRMDKHDYKSEQDSVSYQPMSNEQRHPPSASLENRFLLFNQGL